MQNSIRLACYGVANLDNVNRLSNHRIGRRTAGQLMKRLHHEKPVVKYKGVDDE